MTDKIKDIIAKISAPDASVGEAAQAHLDSLTKPLNSLGRLEEIARRLAVMRGTTKLKQPKPAVTVFAADHGVAAAGVSLYPAEVTAQMVLNFLAGGAGINVLSNQIGATVKVVDVGVNFDFADDLLGLVKAKVAKGSGNMLEGPAMTPDQAGAAMEVGANLAAELIATGHDLLIAGEMGIGNTTPAAALTAVFCKRPPSQVTGRGTGIDDDGLAKKVAAVEKALTLHMTEERSPFQVLCSLGGLEIAAMAGYMLTAAANRAPVVLDGFIATSAALVAARLAPLAASYFFAGHCSVEIGHKVQLDALGLTPILDLNMRLGEGTGAALATQVIKGAVAIYNEMATFESAGVSNKEV